MALTFSIILLGVLFILVMFNVGESVYKKLNINKKTLIIIILLTLATYFIPGIKIGAFCFSLSGFFIPLIISFIVLINVKSLKKYSKMFVALLISFTMNIVYNLLTFDVYESAILQPYLVLAILLGVIPLFLAGTPERLFVSNFFGIILADLVFYISRYSIYGNFYLILGSEKVIACLLFSFVVSVLSYFLARKIKTIKIRRKLKQKEKSMI